MNGLCWTERSCGYSTPCWIFDGKITSEGYGYWPREGRTAVAHRGVYEDAHGVRLPRHVIVHHRCEVKACIRPSHLEPMWRGPHGRLHLTQHGRYSAIQPPRLGDDTPARRGPGPAPLPAVPYAQRGGVVPGTTVRVSRRVEAAVEAAQAMEADT